MLGHFEPCWHHIGLRLGHLRLFWGLCWPLFGTWTFHCRWIFVHASHLPKNTVKTRESNDFLGCVAWWSLLLFCFFLLGYAAHRLCLPDLGLILGHSRLCQCHIDLMLGHFGLFCGLSWPLLGLLLWPYWHYLGPQFVHFGPHWHHIRLMLSLFWGYCVVCVGLCRARVGAIFGWSLAFLDNMLGNFGICCVYVGHFGPRWQRWHRIRLMLSHFGWSWGLCWHVLAFVGAMLGHLGPRCSCAAIYFWNMLCCSLAYLG